MACGLHYSRVQTWGASDRYHTKKGISTAQRNVSELTQYPTCSGRFQSSPCLGVPTLSCTDSAVCSQPFQTLVTTQLSATFPALLKENTNGQHYLRGRAHYRKQSTTKRKKTSRTTGLHSALFHKWYTNKPAKTKAFSGDLEAKTVLCKTI